MFGFANALLLLLLAAACLDFVPVLRRRLSPAAWWAEERPLFCARGAAVRQRYGTAAFLLGVMVYEFIVVFNNSMARENWPWLQTRVSPVLDWVMYLCFGCKILLGTRYSGRSLLCAGALYFVARWVYFNGQNIWWLGLCVALLAAKDVPLRRCMKALLACGLPPLALVELLHFAGVIAPDASSERDGSFRLMFGYGHPNTFGGVVFGLVLAWVLLRRARLTWAELTGVAVVGAFLMIGPKSRSAALCSFLLVALLAAAKLHTRRGPCPGSRTLAAGCAALVPSEYTLVTPHNPGTKTEQQSDVLTVSNYKMLKNALRTLVQNGVEHGVIHTSQYEVDIEADLPQAVYEIAREDPIGAYAIDYITHDCTLIVAYYEIKVDITFRDVLTPLDEIEYVGGETEAGRLISRALEDYDDHLTLYATYPGRPDYAALVQDLSLIHI